MDIRVLIVLTGCFLFGGAVYGLHVEKMRVTTACHDARLYMDGGIDANIESGGFNFHRTISVYKKHLREKILLGTLEVKNEVSGHVPVETYTNPNMKLSIFKDREPSPQGVPARFEGTISGEKYSVAMNCNKK